MTNDEVKLPTVKTLDLKEEYVCHDLAKQLSQYLFFLFFSFLFIFIILFIFISFGLVSYIRMCEILARVRVSIVYK